VGIRLGAARACAFGGGAAARDAVAESQAAAAARVSVVACGAAGVGKAGTFQCNNIRSFNESGVARAYISAPLERARSMAVRRRAVRSPVHEPQPLRGSPRSRAAVPA